MTTMHFGTALRLLRLDAGMSLGELARRIGVSAAYVSRVEHGHDPAPTPDRLGAIARALDLPPLVLVELAAHTGAALAGYLQQVPPASALFLDIARRGLSPSDLAQVQQFIEETFPERGGTATRVRISDLLEPSHVVVGVSGADVAGVVELGVMRWDLPAGLRPPDIVARMLERERQASTALGAGVMVPHVVVDGAPVRAAVVTLARPLKGPTPDGAPVSVAFVLLLPTNGRRHLELLAQVARLASRGVADTLHGIRSAARILSHIEALEAL